MSTSKGFKEKFIAKMSEEIIKELEEKVEKEGRKLTFDDIETGVLLLRQKIGEDLTNKIVSEQGTGKLNKKKIVKNVARHCNTKD